MKHFLRKLHTKRGYTLLFATLTATVVLGVAIFITSVSRKQYILSATARDSMFAIYNADSGIECAVTGWGSMTPTAGVASSFEFYCNDQKIDVNFDGEFASPPPEGWTEDALDSEPVEIYFGADRGCAIVTFFVSESYTKTSIVSRGYNIGDATECPGESPRTVERAMRVTYTSLP